MVVELGLFALVISCLLATLQAFFGLAGAHYGNRRWMAAARPAVTGQWVFIALSFAVLSWAFYKNDFSVLYVASNSNSELPTFYRFTAVWGAHEGSLLLWALALSTWSVAVGIWSRDLPETYAARVLGVLGFVSIGFQLFILLTSSPFERLLPAAVDGRDLIGLGLRPGPRFGEILGALLEWVLEDPSRNRRELLLERASRLAGEEGGDG